MITTARFAITTGVWLRLHTNDDHYSKVCHNNWCVIKIAHQWWSLQQGLQMLPIIAETKRNWVANYYYQSLLPKLVSTTHIQGVKQLMASDI